jgi:exopolysaccharide production protein ExoQ
MSLTLASERAARIRPRVSACLSSTGWWICFLSFSALGLAQAGIKYTQIGGTLAPALFLGLWIGKAAAYPARSVNILLSYRLVYLMPILALASSLWSVDPAHTERMGLEFLITVAVAHYAAGSLRPDMLISANMLAMLLQIVFSLMSGVEQEIEYAGNDALSGLFGSKNFLGYISATLILMAVATAVNRMQPIWLRLVATGGAVLGVVVLIRARSADAIGSCGVGMFAMFAVLMQSRMPRSGRVLLNVGLALVGLCVGAILFAARDALFELLLQTAGKDETLTGRTYLWEHARQYIAVRPWFGSGYQAFWVQGNPDAEGIWRYFQITERAGFHFHNMYYQISVDLGALGAVVWFSVFGVVLIASVFRAVREPTATTAFFMAYMVFLASRLMVEVELQGPFDLAPILVACAWVYAVGPVARARDPAAAAEVVQQPS